MTSTNKPLPTVHYVYEHIHPSTNEIFYIGHGSGGRAWNCGHDGTPVRSIDHKEWINKMINTGYHPGQFVRIILNNLTKEEAKKAELLHIHAIKPIFNKSIRHSSLKFIPELYDKAVKLSTMTVHRGLAGKSISLETALEER
jgi:hypothetical protein